MLPTSAVIAGTPFADLGSSWTGYQWSPTGEWLLLRRGSHVSLIRASDMSLVRQYELSDAEYGNSVDWIDSESFLLYSSETTPGMSGKAWRSSVTSTDLSEAKIPLDGEDTLSYAQGLANGRGAIAFTTGNEYDQSCATDECPRFQVWTDGSVSDVIKGWPAAWSPDGTRLAVVRPLPETSVSNGNGHIVAAGVNFDYGWLEVLSYPDLQPVYANRDINVADIEMAFSPSGRHLRVKGPRQDEILDLETTKLTQAPADLPICWYVDDNLVMSDGRDLVEYSLDGSIVQRWDDMGDGPLAASADGTLVVTTDHYTDATAVNTVRDGQAVSFPLPSLPDLTTVDRFNPIPTRGGRAVLLETFGGDNFHALLVLQVP